jgi:DNA mismatch repair protein MutS2
MQIPAAPDSALALFDRVCADIGDEQDIQQSLSTFSAHLRNIVRIVACAGEGSLVLLDEVGAGTDPSEGAALAKAILTSLKELGARVIATTHYGELKEFAYTSDRVENAAVEFDRESLRPTYRVLVGVPGSSHALYIARRLGLAAEIVGDAESRMGSRDRSVGEMMERIEQSRTRAHALEREASAERRAAESARLEYERKAREIADIRRTIRKEAEEETRAVVRRVTEKAENILEELRKANRGARKGPSARRKLVELRKETAEALGDGQHDETEAPPTPKGHVFRKGDHVRVTSLGADGRIIDDPGDSSAQVQVGSMRTTLPLDVLRPIAEPKSSAPPKDRLSAATISLRKAMHIGPEVMIRAMRVEEAQQLLDRYMDDAYAAGIREARIVHGRGTGILRKFVQEYLRVHPLVHEQRPADESEGGAGATVAVLKD